MAQGSSRLKDTPHKLTRQTSEIKEVDDRLSGRGTHRAHKMTENSVWRREQGTTERAVNLSVWVG